jgi:RNA polymerase sigma-70 factor, ECF subfamily
MPLSFPERSEGRFWYNFILRTDIPQCELPLHELLVGCLQSRDPKLWERLAMRLQPVFARIVYRVVRNMSAAVPADVDDVVQECFIKLGAAFGNWHDQPAAFGSEQTAIAYLKVLAANAARDYVRKKNAEKRGCAKTTSAEDRLQEIAGAHVPDLERKILISQIDQFLGDDVKGRTIFWLYYRQGFTAKEISEIPVFQLSPKGVESLLRRLADTVREQLNGPKDFPDRRRTN